MYLDQYNDNTYVKCLDLLQDGLENINKFLKKISENENFGEIENLIEIYNYTFSHRLLKVHIKFKTTRIHKPHYVSIPSTYTKVNSYWHITLQIHSVELMWLNDIYEGQLSKVLKLYVHTFSKINNFLTTLDRSQSEKYHKIFTSISNENKKYIESIKNREEFEKKEKLEDKLIQNFPYDGLYHMTDIKNLSSILKYGLLSHNSAHNKTLVQTDISNKQVNNRREKIHDYVPLYFNPKNPMQYAISNSSLVFIKISPHVILENNVYFSDGNAASSSTKFYKNIDDLNKLDWNAIRTKYWTGIHDGKRKINAEVLVKDKIETYLFTEIYTKTEDVLNEVIKLFPNHLGINISVNNEIYF